MATKMISVLFCLFSYNIYFRLLGYYSYDILIDLVFYWLLPLCQLHVFIHIPILIPSRTLFIICCKYKLNNNKYNYNYLVNIWFDWSLKTDLNLENIRYGLIYMLLWQVVCTEKWWIEYYNMNFKWRKINFFSRLV